MITLFRRMVLPKMTPQVKSVTSLEQKEYSLWISQVSRKGFEILIEALERENQRVIIVSQSDIHRLDIFIFKCIVTYYFLVRHQKERRTPWADSAPSAVSCHELVLGWEEAIMTDNSCSAMDDRWISPSSTEFSMRYISGQIELNYIAKKSHHDNGSLQLPVCFMILKEVIQLIHRFTRSQPNAAHQS